jgi:hypothetical protein
MGLLTRIGLVVGSFGIASAAVAGCGDDPSHVQQNEFQAKMVHALCDSVQGCCTTAEREFDAVGCSRAVQRQFVVPLSDTTLLYDSAQAGACIQAVTQAAQACRTVDPTTCFNAFIGNKPPGTPCMSSFECAPGSGGYAVCSQDGMCVQPNRGVAGEVCSFTCIEGDGAPRCKSVFYGPSAGQQAACHTENGLVCVTSTTGPATCQSMAADCKQSPTNACPTGQLCDVNADRCYVPTPVGGSCAQNPCGKDGYCAGAVCVPLKPNAATCAQDGECQSGKCENSFCVVYSQAAAAWCGPIVTR